jgi:hypothetical protein
MFRITSNPFGRANQDRAALDPAVLLRSARAPLALSGLRGTVLLCYQRGTEERRICAHPRSPEFRPNRVAHCASASRAGSAAAVCRQWGCAAAWTAPPPSRFAASMVPACAVTIAWQIASPSPAPRTPSALTTIELLEDTGCSPSAKPGPRSITRPRLGSFRTGLDLDG